MSLIPIVTPLNPLQESPSEQIPEEPNIELEEKAGHARLLMDACSAPWSVFTSIFSLKEFLNSKEADPVDPLKLCIAQGNFLKVHFLIGSGFSGRGEGYVEIAVSKGFNKIAKYLIEEGFDFKKKGRFYTPLESAYMNSNKEMIELLSEKIDWDDCSESDPPFWLAVKNGNIHMCKKLYKPEVLYLKDSDLGFETYYVETMFFPTKKKEETYKFVFEKVYGEDPYQKVLKPPSNTIKRIEEGDFVRDPGEPFVQKPSFKKSSKGKKKPKKN